MKVPATDCRGKTSYATRSAAHAAKVALIAKSGSAAMDVFACAGCGGFHFGHRKWAGRAIKRAKRGGDRVRTKLARYLELIR